MRSLDVALFSLSLMGANFTDYLREVWRVLKLDGQLHVFEATSRFSNRDAFVAGLKKLGFAIVEVCDARKFTHIRAVKQNMHLRAMRHGSFEFSHPFRVRALFGQVTRGSCYAPTPG